MPSSLPRILLLVHRWLGVVLAAVVTMWFVSGIVMIYRGYPSVEREDHLRRSPALDPAAIVWFPHQLFEARSGLAPPATLTLMTVDGRPAYVGGGVVVFADDGQPLERVDGAMRDRAAAQWAGRPVEEARRREIAADDVWTIGNLRGVRPLFKYEWPDGQHVYVDGDAVVAQYTTRASRLWAWLGAIPHWLYVPVLRAEDALWVRVIIGTSVLVLVTTCCGIAVGVLFISPRRRYRVGRRRRVLPSVGWRRWHTILGFAGSIVVIGWTFSGIMSLEPAALTRLIQVYLFQAGGGGEDHEGYALLSSLLAERPVAYTAYAARTPVDALEAVGAFGARTIEYLSIEDQPVYLLTDGDADTRIVPVHGTPVASLDPDALAERLRQALGSRAEISRITAYDAYYRDRRGRLPLPVVAVQMQDAARSRHYVDPRTASVVHSHASRSDPYRWFHRALHTFDVPPLVGAGWRREAVMVTLLLCGTALCVTSLVLAWRALTVRLLRTGRPRGPGPGPQDSPVA